MELLYFGLRGWTARRPARIAEKSAALLAESLSDQRTGWSRSQELLAGLAFVRSEYRIAGISERDLARRDLWLVSRKGH